MNKSSVLGIEENLGGLIAYIPFMFAAYLFWKEENRFIRFHSIQALALFCVFTLVYFLISFFSPWAISTWLGGVWFMCYVSIGIVAALKAYQGERWKLPVLGDLAERQTR